MIDLDQIALAYGTRFRGALEPLSGGLDADATTFRIAGEDGDYFLKHRTSPDHGAAFALDLANHGIAEVVAPIPTVTGQPTLQTVDGWILLYPNIEGANALDRPPTTNQWRQLGQALRKIHDHIADLPIETFHVEGIDTFRSTMRRLTESEPRDQIERDLALAISDQRQAIESCLIQVQHFGEVCAAHRHDLVPCHTDLHAANLLIGDGGGLWIVDWDHPRLAPRECDLMFILDGGIFGAHGPDEERAFFGGYGDFTPDLDLLAYYRYARIVEDLLSFCEEAVDLEGPLESRWGEVRYFRMAIDPRGLIGKASPAP